MKIDTQNNITDGVLASSLLGLSVATINEYLAFIGLLLALPLAILRLKLAILEYKDKKQKQ